MRAAGWAFLFCAAGILIDSLTLFGETYIFSYLPPGPASQLVAAKLIAPLELLDVLFVLGAVVFGFLWVRGSSQSADS